MKKKQSGAAQKFGGALSALGRKLNKLTAQTDPELAVDDHLSIEEEEDEYEVTISIFRTESGLDTSVFYPVLFSSVCSEK